jgi:hypothetical protein
MIYKRNHSIEITDQSYIEHFGSLLNAKKSCFNIGAGSWHHPAPCIFHNLVESKSLPIKEFSADLIYTSHVIEHIPDINVNNLFLSAFAALKRGGILRVVTGPDADTDFSALMRKDDNWWYFYEDEYLNRFNEDRLITLNDKWLLHFASPRSVFSSTPCDRKYSASEINDIIEKYYLNPSKLRNFFTDGLNFNCNFAGDHLSWWNAEKLIIQLRQSGFAIVEKSAYGQSRSVFMRDMSYFDTTYPQISLYIEAVKE